MSNDLNISSLHDLQKIPFLEAFVQHKRWIQQDQCFVSWTMPMSLALLSSSDFTFFISVLVYLTAGSNCIDWIWKHGLKSYPILPLWLGLYLGGFPYRGFSAFAVIVHRSICVHGNSQWNWTMKTFSKKICTKFSMVLGIFYCLSFLGR